MTPEAPSRSFVFQRSPLSSGVGFGVVLVWACLSIFVAGAQAMGDLKAGDPIPALRLETLDGEVLDTSGPHAAVEIYLFGQSAHERTQKAFERIAEAIKDPELDGVEIKWVFILSKGSDPKAVEPVEALASGARGAERSVVMVYDRDRLAFGAFGVFTMPAVVIGDRRGRVVHFMPTMTARFDDILTDAMLLAGGKITRAQFERTLEPVGEPEAGVRIRAKRFVNLAHQASKSGLDDVAYTQYIRAIKVDPAFVEPRLGLGRLLSEQGKLDKAREVFEKLLEIEPGNTRAELGLAGVLIGQGGAGLGEADTIVGGILGDEPENPRAIYTLGLLLDARGETTRAGEAFKRAARLLLEPDAPDAP